jgi:hypothetical protein
MTHSAAGIRKPAHKTRADAVALAVGDAVLVCATTAPGSSARNSADVMAVITPRFAKFGIANPGSERAHPCTLIIAAVALHKMHKTLFCEAFT